MTTVRLNVTSTPREEITRFIREIGNGNIGCFIDHLVNFSLPIAEALHGGAKIATGNELMGYHEVDMTLGDPIDPFPGVALSFRFFCEIPDVPTLSKLERVCALLGTTSHGEAINRMLYWFWIAAQLTSIARPILIMEHHKGKWGTYVYPPLARARDALGY